MEWSLSTLFHINPPSEMTPNSKTMHPLPSSLSTQKQHICITMRKCDHDHGVGGGLVLEAAQPHGLRISESGSTFGAATYKNLRLLDTKTFP